MINTIKGFAGFDTLFRMFKFNNEEDALEEALRLMELV